MLSNWDRLINGSLIYSAYKRLGTGIFNPDPVHQQHFWGSRLDKHGLILENVYAFLMHDYGFEKLVRHIPTPAYLVCAQCAHNRTSISALDKGTVIKDKHSHESMVEQSIKHDLMTTSSHTDDMFSRNFSCMLGGPKYLYEGITALHLAKCMGHSEWDCELLWKCWCSNKLSYETSWSVYPSQLLCMGCLAFLPPERQDYWVNIGKKTENILPYHTHTGLQKNETLRAMAERNDFARLPSEKTF